MNFILSVVLTVGLHHPVMIFGCCPVANVMVMAVPVLVIDRPVPVVPNIIPAQPHRARI